MTGSRRLLLPAVAVAALALAAGCGTSNAVQPSAAQKSARPSPAPSSARPVTRAVYPLTGLPVTDPGKARRPALSVKIDNVAGAFPQAGLNQADLVADALVEGGLTRLLATFQSHDAPLIGPIRSARPVDADLLRQLNGGYFGYSGAAAGEIAPTIDHGLAVRLSWDDDPAPFHRQSGYASPHNVFASTASLYAAGHARNAHMPPPPQLFSYNVTVPSTPAVHNVSLAFSPFASAGWTWDGREWLRTQDGRPDTLADGSRVSTQNVVIMSVAVRGTGIYDAAGNQDPLDVVVGSGHVWVLRDGHLVQGSWQRPSYKVPMRIVDAHGAVIPLRAGRTWLELLPQSQRPVFG